MKILHTSDWHVGKTVRGRSRASEHIAVLREIASIAQREAVDLVLVVGDLFDTAAPTPEAERIVYRALLDLAADGRQVVVVAGNHDNPRRLAAVSPLLELGNVHVATALARPDEGGVLELEAGGQPVRVALVPFPSQRYVVTAADLMGFDPSGHAQKYDDRVRQIIAALTAGFRADAVNLIAAHLMVAGGVLGGGERSAHTIFDYYVGAVAFPASAHYVALGHLHRAQSIDGPCPIRYCGSPLQMDFGEQADRKAVLIVDAEPNTPAAVREVPLSAGRTFVTLRGTLAELEALAGERNPVADDDPESPTGEYLRIIVKEKARFGLADEVRELFPDAVELKIDAPSVTVAEARGESRRGRSPHELFELYLAEKGVDDPSLLGYFDQLLDEAERLDDEDEQDEPGPGAVSNDDVVGGGA
ncbi:MAG: exonuclease SbcCD subunit D [Acidimicrobiales bacterium]|nr:exonuclease SbcCD subunit D [Acidimicrobiales bacterium]